MKSQLRLGNGPMSIKACVFYRFVFFALAIELWAKPAAIGQTFQQVYAFQDRDACSSSWPEGALVQGRDGNFYGTTYLGGTNCVQGSGLGSVYRMSPDGTFS